VRIAWRNHSPPMPPVLEAIELAAGVGADGGGPAQRPHRQPQACGGRCPAAGFVAFRKSQQNQTTPQISKKPQSYSRLAQLLPDPRRSDHEAEWSMGVCGEEARGGEEAAMWCGAIPRAAPAGPAL